MTVLTRDIRNWFGIGLIAALTAAGPGFTGFAWAEDAQPVAADAQQAENQGGLQLDGPAPKYDSEIEAYCANIADAARDQRYLRQKQELEGLRAQVDERVKLLEQRSAEYKVWVEKRQDFVKLAEGQLGEIYKKMKPDAAASQLELVSPAIAAAIVMNLDARQSSAILSEMSPDKAAMLAGIIADAAAKQNAKEPS